MFRKYSRTIAAVVLCFFTWTSGGVFSIANAAQIEARKAKTQRQEKKPEGAEEKFSKVTGEMEEILSDPKEDIESKKERLRAKEAEVDALDTDIRKQFAETEKRLKDAKLPAEIMERHRRFVKHYDDNLAELKGNIERVEKAKNKKEADAEVEKAHKHLEKVKAPSRHQKLDPNNLPHRQPKVIKREPRLKKEEFERDLKKDKNAWRNEKRIMVASAGSLAGLLTSSIVNAVIPPMAADLAETVDVQLTPEIRAKALELEYKPVRIYEWVRNNIEFVPTWGSIQGAQMTMLTKQGNAFDTASLLIALLRASGIHARYTTGTITLPIDKIMNWAGGFTDPMAALDFMSSGGIAATALTEGGKVTHARFEHVWVEAFINYIPSRGAKHVNGKGETWISLDPSYKQYTYTQGLDIKSAVPFDAQAYLTQIKSTATINESQGYITGVDSTFTQQTMQDYQTRAQSYISQNYPNATVGDVLGKKEIVKKEYPYLLGTLPYRTSIRGTAFTEIPDSLRHKLSFRVTSNGFDETPIELSLSLPELAGKKITLSYSPATPQDEAVINSYLPKPHADGTPIQPSEIPSSLPAYLINVKPELRVDGQIVATGSPVTLGSVENFTMDFSSPWIPSDQVINKITAGTYHAIALDLGRISAEQAQTLKSRLEATKAKLTAQNYAGLTKDELIGDLLYTTALMYHAEVGLVKQIKARTAKVAYATWPSETIFKTSLSVSSFFGIPRSVSAKGMTMDADKLATVSTALNGDQNKKINFLLQTGMASSVLEHLVPEQLFSTPENPVEGVSAVKALMVANDQGVPIYTVNQANISTVLSQLQVDQAIKTDIQNAVNAGKIVTVPKTDISYKGWSGCGYIVIDPTSGAGAYMISGGESGSEFQYAFWTVMLVLAWVAVIAGIIAGLMLGVIFVGYGAAAFPVLGYLSIICGRLGERYLDLTMSATESLLEFPLLEGVLTTLYDVYSASPNTGLPTSKDLLSFFIMLRTNISLFYKNKISYQQIFNNAILFACDIVNVSNKLRYKSRDI